MEYYSVRTLFDFIKNGDRLTEDQVRLIMAQLLLSLDFAHKKGLIHRDIKLDNVLVKSIDRVNNYFEVKIADMGLTTYVPYNEREMLGGDILGTPCYIAPEIL